MCVNHNGYTIRCDVPACSSEHDGGLAETKRTAISKARADRWFIGRIRITSGAPQRKVRTVSRVFCPGCSWLVGAP